ncbi:uncharacterized protein KQ657_001864 [Scheffersomyces spartinae]|uniref:Cytochrome P450 n=1 Tax=Scheffersomyces spartinae TaxID=45513 RepID=A0A9P8AH94_9ASCO|nr:uncharacterized protein KQ657_001864 [Scheffersomyces spartinae]KAG7192463.1 hypothetical protein KQ657_001864 [Scheffersomyces spartinae]
MPSWINALQFVILAILLWFIADTLGFRKIKGIPSIPGYPVVGNLLQILDNPSLKYTEWSNKYKTSIFQIRLGNTRAVIVNDYHDIEVLWCKNKNIAANNSRPLGYTFHDIVSSTQGLTVGSSPFNESYVRKKKAISSVLNQSKVHLKSSTIGSHVNDMFKQFIASQPPSHFMSKSNLSAIPDINMMPYVQNMILGLSICLIYGLNVDKALEGNDHTIDITRTENEILHLRSPFTNLKDYIPILRFISSSSKQKTLRSVRDQYMNKFWNTMVQEIDLGNPTVIASIMGQLYLGMVNGSNELNIPELKSICLSMVSAGLDNTPLNYNHLMGHLSQLATGEVIQKKAYNALMELYDNDLQLAWNSVESESTCPYIIALIQETLRIFTVLPLALPRCLSKDIIHKGVLIPKGTVLIMNAYQANHDSQVFQSPTEFFPERWLNSKQLNHFSFGAGARMCSGNLLACKQLYVLIAKTILMFHIKPPMDPNYQMKLSPFEMNGNPSATCFEPKLFKVRLEPRCTPAHECLYYNLFS